MRQKLVVYVQFKKIFASGGWGSAPDPEWTSPNSGRQLIVLQIAPPPPSENPGYGGGGGGGGKFLSF